MCGFYIVLIDTTELREQLEEEIRQFAEVMSRMQPVFDLFAAIVEQIAQQIRETILNEVSDDDSDGCWESKALKRVRTFPFPADIRMDILPWYTSGFE